MMNNRLIFPMLILAACLLAPQSVLAAEEAEEAPKAQSTRSKNIFGPPVNVNISGPGTVPKGVLYTAINTSFASRVRPTDNRGNKPPDAFQQQWLLKLRYGILDNLEVVAVVPYIHRQLSNASSQPRYPTIYGLMDSTVYLAFAPWQERRGDPFTASVSAGAWLPVGSQGWDNMPGSGAWAFRSQAAIGKWLTKDIKVDTEVVWSSTRSIGSQNVRIGDNVQWNSQIRYLFDYFDIGLESTLVWQTSGRREKSTWIPGRPAPASSGDMRNGFTEWFIGPSINFAIEPLGMWAGVGAFFPVMQRFEGPKSKVENVRFEFKIGKLW